MRAEFDLHVHSFFSADAVGTPEQLVAAGRAAGLSGIAITDHDSARAIEYCLKRGLMREDGRAVDGFLIIPAIEISTADGHLVSLGVPLEGYRRKPAPEAYEAVKAAGGLPVPVHPWDKWRAGIRREILDTLDLELIEGFNAACTRRLYNELATHYATQRGLGITAASDAHHPSAVGTSRTAVEVEELTVSHVLAALRSKPEPMPRYLSRREGLKKHFGNWFRVFNPKPPKFME